MSNGRYIGYRGQKFTKLQFSELLWLDYGLRKSFGGHGETVDYG
jgi:hypothetical protein